MRFAAGRERVADPSVADTAARAIGIVVFVLGGLLVFQGSDGLDVPKSIYMALTLIAVSSATIRLIRERAVLRQDPVLMTWLTVGAAFGAVVVVSLPVAMVGGIALTSWLRDAAPYAMFAIAPLLGVDGRWLPRRFFVVLLVVGGALAVTSFAVEWTTRRLIVELPIDRLVLPTGILASTLLAYAAARSVTDRRYLRWILVAGLVLGTFFVTGTRSTLLLVAVPIAVSVCSSGGFRRAVSAVVGTLLVALIVPFVFSVVVIGVAPLPTPTPSPTLVPTVTAGTSPGQTAGPTGQPAAPTPTPKPNPIGDRIDSIGDVIADPAGDASLAERIAQTRAAWEVFVSGPLLGTGPGHMIDWVSEVRGPRSGFNLDTPLIYLAKFGIVGLLAPSLLLSAFVITIRAGRRRQADTAVATLVGVATVFGIAGLLNSPFEDKGLSFGLVLILGTILTADRPTAPGGR